MKKLYITFILSFGFIFSLNSASDPGVTVPLTYHPKYGVYTAIIKVGHDPVQEIEAIVDTGSSAMVFTGDESFCPKCKNALTKGALKPEKMKALEKNKDIPLSYGSANDTATEYRAPVQFTDNSLHTVDMHIFVLKDSDQPSSILGMIQHDLRENLVEFTPFLAKVTENFKKYKELTFALCGEDNKSYFHVGEMPLPEPIFSTKLYASKFYEIDSTGFYTQTDQPIVKTTEGNGGAIIDTGTGGFIVMSQKLYQPLFKYIHDHSNQSKNLDEKFWKENYCILKKDIDLTSFPTIKIGFKTLDNKTGFLTLKPSTYINGAGCDDGYIRLVFMSEAPPTHPTAIRNHHLRKKAGLIPEMVIGTSILNEYPIHIHYQDNPYLSFFDKKDFCKNEG